MCQHAASPPVDTVAEIDGVQTAPAGRAVVETVRGISCPVAVSVVDQALRLQIATSQELSGAPALFAGRAGIGTAARAVGFGNGRAESVGKSRLRVLLADLGLPAPVLQAEIRDSHVRFAARVGPLFALKAFDSGLLRLRRPL